jgi:hypothetical protein
VFLHLSIETLPVVGCFTAKMYIIGEQKFEIRTKNCKLLSEKGKMESGLAFGKYTSIKYNIGLLNTSSSLSAKYLDKTTLQTLYKCSGTGK